MNTQVKITKRNGYGIPLEAEVTEKHGVTKIVIEPMGHMFYAISTEYPDGSTYFQERRESPRSLEEWVLSQ
jgi:hypothetical protein